MFGHNREMPSIGKEIEKLEQIDKIRSEAVEIFDREAKDIYLQNLHDLPPESLERAKKQVEGVQANAKERKIYGAVHSEPKWDKDKRVVGFDETVDLGISYEHEGGSSGYHPKGLESRVFSKLSESHDPATVDKVRKEFVAQAIRQEMAREQWNLDYVTKYPEHPVVRYGNEGIPFGKREHEMRKAALEKLLKQYE